ncbi:UNVERIFIED_CONTAM: hypothetical protein RMT77_010951 [Armadillidium vulgare]
MAEGNEGGGEATVQQVEDSERTEDYQKLIDYGLNEKVAVKLDEIYQQGKLKHEDLDERALDALKEFPVEGAVTVLKQFLESNLEHVSNKSAYLCGVMKTYRQRKQYNSTSTSGDSLTLNPGKGPNKEKLKAIIDKSGYTLDVTTGQRKYGGPPPNWEGPAPGPGCEVFCGKIPKDLYEDELIPLFENCGTVWDLRLMMDPLTGQNRGYAFVTFTTREAANEAVKQLDNYTIRDNATLKVNISIPNLRLFVGNIPKSKSQEEILEEFSKRTGNIPKNRERHELYEEFTKHAPGLAEVIIYSSPDDKKKNRGFCFLEYESHKAASLAKRRLSSGRLKVWGCEIIVDWADPQEEPDDDTMSKVKVLYVRNLTQSTTEEMLKEKFEEFGKVERVKKIKDYAFIHFEERDDALKAMNSLQEKELGGANMEISLAKPPSDKKKKEEVLRNREKRLMQMLAQRGMPVPPAMLRSGRGGGGSRLGGARSDYDYEFYGYGDYQGGYCDPYFEDFYRYEDYFACDYSSHPMGGRSRSKPIPSPAGRGYGMANRGRGAAGPYPRGVRGGLVPPFRGVPMGQRMARPMRGGLGGRGGARGPNLAGKRRLESGHQNEGDAKRRLQTASDAAGGESSASYVSGGDGGGDDDEEDSGGGEEQWYKDTCPQSWS